MAGIRVDGNVVPLIFPLDDARRSKVPSHMLHVRFRFVESSIYIEEEKMSEAGELQQSIPVLRFMEDKMQGWYLPLRNYRAYGLSLANVTTSTQMFSRQSLNSSVDMPYVQHYSSPTPPSHVEEVILKPPTRSYCES